MGHESILYYALSPLLRCYCILFRLKVFPIISPKCCTRVLNRAYSSCFKGPINGQCQVACFVIIKESNVYYDHVPNLVNYFKFRLIYKSHVLCLYLKVKLHVLLTI